MRHVISVTRLMPDGGTVLALHSENGPNFSHIHTLDILRDRFRPLDSYAPKCIYVRICHEYIYIYVHTRRKSKKIQHPKTPGRAFAGDINGARAIGS